MSDLNLDESQREFIARAGFKTHLMIPLVVKNRAIGLIELMDDEDERVFTQNEIKLGQTLASQAANAIQNADLYQRLQNHAADLETRVQSRMTELRAAKEHIEGILGSVPDAVYVLDEGNNLIQSNQAGELLLDQAQDLNQDIFSGEFISSIKETSVCEAQNIVEVGERAYQARIPEIHLGEGEPAGQVMYFVT
jgi:GAF domain-containing protein